jgi:hypothetical protein
MSMFRHKPVIVEAVQWTGDDQAWAAICALHVEPSDGTFTALPGGQAGLAPPPERSGMVSRSSTAAAGWA